MKDGFAHGWAPRIVKSSIVAAAVIGLITTEPLRSKFAVLQITLFTLPLAAVVFASESRLIWAFWGSMFLIIQALLSPLLLDQAFKTLPPNLHEIFNVRGGMPGIHGRRVVTTDLQGFRTTKKVDYTSSEGFRIFAIGGSTTEEINVDDASTWTNSLQQNLEDAYTVNVEVINTGVSGLRAIHHLATLRHTARLHPDAAIFLVGINDWNKHIRDHFSSDPWTREGLRALLERLRFRFSLRNTLLGNVISQLYYEAKPTTVRDDFGEHYVQGSSLERKTKRPFRPETVMREYAQTMEEISAACREYNIKCGFITQPTGYQASASEAYKKRFWMTPPHEDYTVDFESLIHIASVYNQYLKDFAKRRGHYFCDAAAEFAPTHENFYDDCHFKTAASQKMGRIVGRCFKEIMSK